MLRDAPHSRLFAAFAPDCPIRRHPGDGRCTEFHVGPHVVTMDLGVQFGLTDPAIDTDAVILGTLF